jgi:hypothetical protein
MKKFISYFTSQNILFDVVPLLSFTTLLIIALIEKRYDSILDKSIIVILAGVIVLYRHLIKKYISIVNRYDLLTEQQNHEASQRNKLIDELKRTLVYSHDDQAKLKNQLKSLKASNSVTPKKNAK